jgi:hypothetical protein
MRGNAEELPRLTDKAEVIKVTDCYVPTFTIDASADWKITYARDSRIDIPSRAAARAAKDLANYEEE